MVGTPFDGIKVLSLHGFELLKFRLDIQILKRCTMLLWINERRNQPLDGIHWNRCKVRAKCPSFSVGKITGSLGASHFVSCHEASLVIGSDEIAQSQMSPH